MTATSGTVHHPSKTVVAAMAAAVKITGSARLTATA
jgi:hypothetical protein